MRLRSEVAPGAARILAENWRGRYTVPAGGLYPHQWSWDSGFHAIGLRHLSPPRAAQELESLFSTQWADGRLPQIVYDPDRDDDYSPGAAFWRTDRTDTTSRPTAGLVQPPIHAWAALLVHRADPGESGRRQFLQRAYPRLRAWHDYLRRRRDRGGLGLAALVHPWESGMDNAPSWDEPLARVAMDRQVDIPRPDLLHAAVTERPTNRDYGTYLYLAGTYRDRRCDDDADHPFLVEDPGFNALWARSEHALADIAETLHLPSAPHRVRAAMLEEALEDVWDPAMGCYLARDVRAGDLQRYRTVSGLLPLLLPECRHVDGLLATLRGEHFQLGRVHLVPSHDLSAQTFDASRYWRGSSWFNIAWLLVQALSERSLTSEAAALATDMVDLAVRHDFPEYVNPCTGAPCGTRRFSWTAALTLDLACRTAG